MAKLAAFDMDGTLLMPNHRLGEKTLSALKRLRERDITLTFATGRHVLEMHHVIGEFSLDAFLITGNGTRIHSLEGGALSPGSRSRSGGSGAARQMGYPGQHARL